MQEKDCVEDFLKGRNEEKVIDEFSKKLFEELKNKRNLDLKAEETFFEDELKIQKPWPNQNRLFQFTEKISEKAREINRKHWKEKTDQYVTNLVNKDAFLRTLPESLFQAHIYKKYYEDIKEKLQIDSILLDTVRLEVKKQKYDEKHKGEKEIHDGNST